jgi:hypothetical protein
MDKDCHQIDSIEIKQLKIGMIYAELRSVSDSLF